MRPLRRAAALLLVLLAAAHGCNLFQAPRSPKPQETLVAEGPRIGETAPEIDGEDVDGARLKLSDFRGKVVVVDFWGNW
jgi:hypothetical protein